MNEKNKLDKKDLSYIIGGAVVGAIAGYIISRVGIKNLMSILKKKELIPSSISSLLKEFTSDEESEE